MSKDELRKIMIFKRDSLNEKEHKRRSQIITSQILNLLAYLNSKTIFTYVSFRSEVDTKSFINKALKDHKRIAVPMTLAREKTIVPCEISSLDDLIPGTWSILEPKKDNCKLLDSKEIDLVIIPGLAFDNSFNRLGYGAGYYDRFLPSLNSSTVKLGIAFDFQLIEQIPHEDNDIQMDGIITDRRLLINKDKAL